MDYLGRNNASDKVSGFKFQEDAALYTFIIAIKHNAKNVKEILTEHRFEDIQLNLNNGDSLFYQVKWNKHVNKGTGTNKLKKGIKSLLDDLNKFTDKAKLISLIVNSNEPFGRISSKDFKNSIYSDFCKELSNKEKEQVSKYIDCVSENGNYSKKILDELFDKISIMKISYSGNTPESKIATISKEAAGLISKLRMSSCSEFLLLKWRDLFSFETCSTDTSKKITKEQFAAYAESVSLKNYNLDDLYRDLNISKCNKSFIDRNYDDKISLFQNDFTLKNKIVNHYQEYNKKNMFGNGSIEDYVNDNYDYIINDLGLDENNESDINLSKFIIASVLENSEDFKNIEDVIVHEN